RIRRRLRPRVERRKGLLRRRVGGAQEEEEQSDGDARESGDEDSSPPRGTPLLGSVEPGEEQQKRDGRPWQDRRAERLERALEVFQELEERQEIPLGARRV